MRTSPLRLLAGTPLLWPLALLLAAPALAQPPSSCTASLTPIAAREGGAAELIGDVVLDCSGPAGSNAARLEVLLVANMPLGNRNLSPVTDPAWGITDALMLVDDPQPASQKPCVLAGQGVQCSTDGGWNVFQGRRLQENIIAFQSIPVLPAAEGGTRRLRIVNLRRGPDPKQFLQPTLQVMVYSGGGPLTVNNGTFVLPAAEAPFEVSVLTATGALPPLAEPEEGVVEEEGAEPLREPGLMLTPERLPLQYPNPPRQFRVALTEGFASAFRRRSIASTFSDPGRLATQAVPGIAYGTETGFYNSGFPAANGLRTSGRADSGTRIKVAFHDVPLGVDIWAQTDSQPNLGAAPGAARAVLTRSGLDGEGTFTRFHDEFEGYAKLESDGTDRYGVWEIVSSDPAAIDQIELVFALTYGAGALELGEATVSAFMAPIAPEGIFEVDPESFPESLLYPDAYPAFLAIGPEDRVETPAFAIISAPEVPDAVLLSAASLKAGVSPGSIATLTGVDLALATAASGLPVPELAATQVTIVDSAGGEHFCLLYLVSPGQINLVVDPETRAGPAILSVWRGEELVASATFEIQSLAPALFAANGSGTGSPSGLSLAIDASASAPTGLAGYDFDAGAWIPAPLVINEESGARYLVLYGTGFGNRGDLSTLSAHIAGQPVSVLWAAPKPGIPGLDALTIGPLPASLSGVGSAPLTVEAAGIVSNELELHFTH